MGTLAPTPGQIRLEFNPVSDAQRGFIVSPAARVLFSGAFGAGKSIALCSKGLKLSLDHPNNFGLIARKIRSTLAQTTLKTFLELVCPKELIADHNKSEGLVKLVNGSEILFSGLDDALKLGSLNLGWVGIDEAIETGEDDWRMLEGRLRKPNVPHQIFAATNPGPPSHYLYRMFWLQKRGEVFHASSFDNKALPQDYLQRLSEFEGTYYDRYVLGEWKGLEGLVYAGFSEACIIPRFEIDKSWLVYSGHDFGSANPAAMFYAGNPGTGEFFAFAEYLPGATGRSIYDHVQEFKRICEGRNVVKRAGGNHTTEGEIRQGYTAQGWPIVEPVHSQSPMYQIQKVQSLHRNNKIFVFSDLKEYKREKYSFAYEKKDGVLTDKIAHAERFHLMACLIGGTMVETSSGAAPIETIRPGDQVLTRQGYRQVLDAGIVGIQPTHTAYYSNGTQLTGTADHLVFVVGKGFIPLTAQRHSDKIIVWTGRQSFLRGLPITDTLKPGADQIGCILRLAGEVISIERYMKRQMDRCLRAGVCITKMGIRSITTRQTWSVNQLGSICQSIWQGMCTTWNTSGEFGLLHMLPGSNGPSHLRAIACLAKERKANGEAESLSVSAALGVARNIKLSNPLTVSSAVGVVNQPTVINKVKAELSESAQFVRPLTLAENTPATVHAHADVVWCIGVVPSNPAPVYDLSVAGVPEYFANGILVHNSERSILSDFAPETVARSLAPLRSLTFSGTGRRR